MADQEDPWITAMKAKGHVPRLNEDGDGVDIFVTDSGYHNGPGCSICDETWCMHCTNPDKIEPCIGAQATAERDAKYTREHEDRVLAEAEAILARRSTNTKPE